MSEEQGQTGDRAAVRRRPNPWLRVFLGLVVFAVAGGVCVKLVTGYLESRPVDLRAHTLALTDVAEQLLLNLGVPRDKIVRAEPALQQDTKASWQASSLTVELLAGVPIAEAAEPFKREMTARGVSVAEKLGRFPISGGSITRAEALRARDATVESGNREASHFSLTFSLLDHPFLSVSITERPVTDLTATSNQLADEASVILQTQGIPAESIKRSPSEKRQDEQTVWNFTRIEAPLPPSMGLDELETIIRNALTVHRGGFLPSSRRPDARVTAQLGVQGTTALSVSHAGKPCVELVFQRQEPPSAESEDEVSLMEWPSLRGNGVPAFAGMAAPDLEELPLDSSGLEDMELGRKLTGIKFPGEGMPKVAIIVDDGGYGGIITDRVLALNPNLTIAVLPYTPAAQDTARRAAELSFEVMLHMPMEPANMAGRLTTKMSRDEILEKTRDALAEIPQAVGVNNHIGSVFTANAEAIKIFLEVVKERELFFIDSWTTAQSRAYETAKKLGIPTAMRDVFLDNEQNQDYIIGQFNHLIAVAKERGAAIGICHFRRVTVPVLVQMLPQLDRNGIALVHASELLKQRAEKPQ